MILHTIIDPMEVMLDGDTLSPPSYEYQNRNGCVLQCIKRADGIYLDRIISTNLKDYLNHSYQIGEILPNETL